MSITKATFTVFITVWMASHMAKAEDRFTARTQAEFGTTALIGKWRQHGGSCDTPLGQSGGPLVLSQTNVDFTTLSCEIADFRTVSDKPISSPDTVWRLQARCTNGGQAAPLTFVFAAADDLFIMAILTQNDTKTFRFEACNDGN